MAWGRVSGMMKTSTLRTINMVVDAFENKRVERAKLRTKVEIQ